MIATIAKVLILCVLWCFGENPIVCPILLSCLLSSIYEYEKQGDSSTTVQFACWKKLGRNKKMIYSSEHEPVYVDTGLRPFVKYWVWDEATQGYVKKKIETKDKEKAKVIIAEILNFQAQGFVMDSSESEKKTKKEKPFSVRDALSYFLEVKKVQIDENSWLTYSSKVNLFLDWCKEQQLDGVPMVQLTKEHILNYLRFSQEELKNSNTTRNIKLDMLRTIFHFLVEDEKLKENPAAKISKLKEDKANYTAFNREHTKLMLAYMKEHDNDLYFFSLIMFYSFIRPKELALLRVGAINLHTNKILVDRVQGKKGAGFITLTPPLRRLIIEMDIMRKSANELIFRKRGKNDMSNRFRKVRDAMQMPSDYKLYCWKHTGILEHFMAGNNLKWIQRQCRHSDLQTTIHYLEVGLGVDVNYDFIYKEPDI